MSQYKATVIKSGNSYALRVPKAYIDNNKLSSGQKVQLNDPVVIRNHDPKRLQKALEELQKLNPYQDIKDPVAWQRQNRKDRPLLGRD